MIKIQLEEETEQFKTGYIYCIKTKCEKILYVGSTFNLQQRLHNHNQALNSEKHSKHNLKIYCFLRDNDIRWINKLTILQTYENTTKQQLRVFEQDFISENQSEYLQNSVRAFQSKEQLKEYHKERYQQQKEKFKKMHEEYREKNRDKINEKVNCECGGQFTIGNKARHLKTKKHQSFIS